MAILQERRVPARMAYLDGEEIRKLSLERPEPKTVGADDLQKKVIEYDKSGSNQQQKRGAQRVRSRRKLRETVASRLA